MTVAQLLECVVSKCSCMEGQEGDGTPFEEKDVIKMTEDILTKGGYESHGNELLFSGYTGAPFHSTIFIGPTAYKKLRHCVVDKIHARARGPVQLITRQPCEGRSRGGGLRVGEMEKDVLLAHGASATLLDRLKKNSDDFEVAICRKCGHIAEWIHPSVILTTQASHLYCRHCKLSGSANVGIVNVPYSYCLLVRELCGLQISVKMRLEDPNTE
jgi:DNA-directed RNA polymerase II subunit RPB2